MLPRTSLSFCKHLGETQIKYHSLSFAKNILLLILKMKIMGLHISQTLTRLLHFTGIVCINEDRLVI